MYYSSFPYWAFIEPIQYSKFDITYFPWWPTYPSEIWVIIGLNNGLVPIRHQAII